MIKVKVKKTAQTISVEVSGHSRSAEEGKDLICASASILAYTLAQNIKIYKEFQKHSPKIDLRKGYALIKAYPNKDGWASIENIYAVLINGFYMLSENYPEFIKVEC